MDLVLTLLMNMNCSLQVKLQILSLTSAASVIIPWSDTYKWKSLHAVHGINYKLIITFIRQNISESCFLLYLIHDVSVLRPGKFSASVRAGQRGSGEGG